jgi:hypothetical protein
LSWQIIFIVVAFYHRSSSDDYADKISIGTLENLMRKIKLNKPNSYFTCLTINSSTDILYRIMQQNFEGLEILP